MHFCIFYAVCSVCQLPDKLGKQYRGFDLLTENCMETLQFHCDKNQLILREIWVYLWVWSWELNWHTYIKWFTPATGCVGHPRKSRGTAKKMQTRTDTVHIKADPLTDRPSLRIIIPPVRMPTVAEGIFTPPVKESSILIRAKKALWKREKTNWRRKHVETIVIHNKCCILP